jgi:hypothetical protein
MCSARMTIIAGCSESFFERLINLVGSLQVCICAYVCVFVYVCVNVYACVRKCACVCLWPDALVCAGVGACASDTHLRHGLHLRPGGSNTLLAGGCRVEESHAHTQEAVQSQTISTLVTSKHTRTLSLFSARTHAHTRMHTHFVVLVVLFSTSV